MNVMGRQTGIEHTHTTHTRQTDIGRQAGRPLTTNLLVSKYHY